MFLVLTENSFSFNPYQGRNVSDLLGQGRALPTELFSQYVFVCITLPTYNFSIAVQR